MRLWKEYKKLQYTDDRIDSAYWLDEEDVVRLKELDEDFREMKNFYPVAMKKKTGRCKWVLVDTGRDERVVYLEGEAAAYLDSLYFGLKENK